MARSATSHAYSVGAPSIGVANGSGSSVGTVAGVHRGSTLSHVASAFKNGLFGILFVMIKDATIRPFWVIVELCIDMMQLLAFPFNAYSQDFPWNSGQSMWLQRIVKPFVFETYIDTSTAVFFTAVGILILFLLNAVFVGYSFSRNNYRMMWTIRLLRTISGLVSTIFFIPLTGILAARLRCEANTSCWSGFDLFEKILALVVGVAFIFLSLMTGICFSEPSPSARSVLGRPHSRVDLFASIVRASLTVLFTLWDASSTSRWVLSVALLICSVSTSAMFTWYLPYYRHNYSLAKVVTFWVLTWSAVCLLIAQANGTENNQAFVFFLVAIPFIVYSAISAANWRRRYIEQTPCNRLCSASDIELKARFHLIASGIFFTYKPNASNSDMELLIQAGEMQPIDEGAAKKAIAEVNTWYRFAARRNPRSSLLRLFWSNHHQYFMGNNQLALAELQAAEEMSPHLDEQFFIYRRRKMVQDEVAGGKGDVIQFIEFQKHMNDAQQNDSRATKAQLALWTELLKRHPDPMALNRMAWRATTYITRAQTGYQELIRLNPNAPQTFRMYAGFLIDVVHDPLTADMFIARAGELDDAGADREKNAQTGARVLDAESLGVAEMLMDDRFATIAISGDLRKEGSVLEMNTSACRLLGYRPRELLGRNVSAIIPEPFGSHHTRYLRHYLEEGASTVMDRVAFVFAIHKSGYTVPVTMLVRQMCSPTGGIIFLAAMRPVAPTSTNGTEDNYMIVARDGSIITCTAACGGLFGIVPDDFNTGAKLYAQSVVPEYAVYEASAYSETNDTTNTILKEKGRFDSVSMATARGQVTANILVSALASTSGETALVLRFDIAERAVPIERKRFACSADFPQQGAGIPDAIVEESSQPPPLMSIAAARKADSSDDSMDDDDIHVHASIIPRPPSSSRVKEATNRPVSYTNETLPNELPNTPEEASEDTSSPRKSRKFVKMNSKVQFNTTDAAGDDDINAGSATGSAQNLSDTEVRVDVEHAMPQFGNNSYEGRRSLSDMQRPQKARSVTSESHASSTASRIDGVRERILYGDGASTGRLGTVLRVCLLLSVAGIIAIAAISYVDLDRRTTEYASAVENVIQASDRRLHIYEILETTELLVLNNADIYGLYNASTLQSRLSDSADGLDEIHSILYESFKTMSSAQQLLYTSLAIPINTYEGGEKAVQMYNLWNLLEALTSEARAISRLPLSAITEDNPSVYFITQNTLTTTAKAIELSMELYQASAVSANQDASKTANTEVAVAMAITVFATVFVLLPLLVLIERRQTSVIWLFLLVPRQVATAMADHCRSRLESREALDDGRDGDNDSANEEERNDGNGIDGEFVPRSSMKSDHGYSGNDTDNDDNDHVGHAKSRAGKGDGSAAVELPMVNLALRNAHDRRGRGRSHGRKAKRGSIPTLAQRAKLFGVNQARNIVFLVILLAMSVAFFAALHAIVTKFITKNETTAASVNYSNKKNYLTLVSFYLIRELAVANTTERLVHTNELFTNVTLDALQLHNDLLYGNAALGIPGTATEPRFQTLLFKDGCATASPPDCPTFYGGLLSNGLSVAFQSFIRDCKILRVPAYTMPIPRSISTVKAFVDESSMSVMDTFLDQYLRSSMVQMTEMFGTTLTDDVKALQSQHLVGTIVFCCLVGAVYVLLLMPIAGRANHDAKKLQVLLLCVTPDVLKSTPAFASLIRQDYA